jgi:hypothetical protein
MRQDQKWVHPHGDIDKVCWSTLLPGPDKQGDENEQGQVLYGFTEKDPGSSDLPFAGFPFPPFWNCHLILHFDLGDLTRRPE